MKVTAQPGDTNIFKSILDVIGLLLYALAVILRATFNALLPSSYQHRKDINGEIALVTGGGGGLGRLLALRLAKLGATVVVWDISNEGLEETVNLVKGIGGKVFAFKCDLCDKEDVYKTAKKTQEKVGDVTILINNAGVASGLLLLETPDHLIKRTFDVNVLAHFWTAKAFLPKMVEKDHGHIVTIASLAGVFGTYKLVDYCASKFAAVGFDESLRIEMDILGIKGVKTTAICPFFIQQTGLFDDVRPPTIPRLKPNDVADRVIEALRREETFVTIPGSFNVMLALKSIMPWSVVSKAMRNLIPDIPPQHHEAPKVQIKEMKEEVDKTNNLSNTITNLNQRLVTTGKNL